MSQGQQQQLTMGRTEWVMLLALSIVFGGAFFFFEIGVQTFAALDLCVAEGGGRCSAALALCPLVAPNLPHRLGLGPPCWFRACSTMLCPLD